MQILFAIEETGNILLQICGFLLGLMLFWILVLSGEELWRDKAEQKRREKQERERVRKEMEKRKQELKLELERAKKRQQEREKQIRKEVEREKTCQDMKKRYVENVQKHLFSGKNNYRKMHHIPLVRKGGSNYADHIDRKLKRGSR